MNELNNFATVIGNYNDLQTTIQSDSITTLLINNLEINKSANKSIWATKNLIYTITIVNPTSVRFENVTVTDILNPTFVRLIVESLRINKIPVGYDYVNYDDSTGLLNIIIPIIEPNQTVVINFAVMKQKNNVFRIDNYASLTFDGNTITSNVVTVYALSKICKCKEIKNNTP